MNLTGKLTGAAMDYSTGQMRITFAVNEEMIVKSRFDYEKDLLLDITTKKHTEKRSLNANAYFHVLCGKIADYLKIPKGRVKNYLLFEYGQRELDEDGNEMYLKVPESDLNWWLANEQIHLWSVGSDGNSALMVVLKHSAELNKEEFATLLEGTISDCKDCGIETITPEEMAKMIALMENR